MFDEVAELTRPELEGRALPVTFDAGENRSRSSPITAASFRFCSISSRTPIKFTDSGWVRVTAVARDGRIELSVADTGRGIPRARLQAIFDPFVQVRPHSGEDRGGVGLGLAITRELMRLMSGELACRERGGSRFDVHGEAAARLTTRTCGAGQSSVTRVVRVDGDRRERCIISPRSTARRLAKSRKSEENELHLGDHPLGKHAGSSRCFSQPNDWVAQMLE